MASINPISSITSGVSGVLVAELAGTTGEVSLIRASGEVLNLVEDGKGVPIYRGDIIQSHDNSSAIVHFSDKSFLSLGQNRTLSLTQNFFDELNLVKQSSSVDQLISLANLEQAIAEGESLESLLQVPAAGEGLDGSSSSTAKVIFFQRIGSEVIPISLDGSGFFCRVFLGSGGWRRRRQRR